MKSRIGATAVRLGRLLTCGVASVAGSADFAVAAAVPTRAAFVFESDLTTAQAFQTVLGTAGFAVTNIQLNDAATTNFGAFDLVMVASDTTASQIVAAWDGSPAAVSAIKTSGKPVVGLGYGGATFFEHMGTFINYGQTWGTGGNQVFAVDPGHQVWRTPFPISVPPGNLVSVYSSGPTINSLYIPSPVPNVVTLAREAADPVHYPIVIEQGKYVYWGFWSGPQTMTVDGQHLLINTLRALVPFAIDPTSRLYVEAAAHISGFGGTPWRTDLEILNTGATQASYMIELLKRDQANPNPQALSYSLAPGASARYPDIIGGAFGYTGAATLRITPLVGTVMADSRTYNDDLAGTYGQGIPGVPESSALAYGQTARLIMLSQSADDVTGYRTALGFTNATGSSIAVEAAFYTADGGLLGTYADTLDAFKYIQIDRILRRFTPATVSDAYALVRTTTPGGRFFAYASLIDNRSRDPVFMPAR